MSEAAGARNGQATPPKRSWLRWAPVLAVGVIVAGVLASGAWRYFSIDELKVHRNALHGFVALHPVGSVVIYIGVYCAFVALSLPGALIMTLTGGLLFGPWLGGAAAVTGVSSGAILMFLIARSSLGDLVRRRARPDGMLMKLERGIRRHAFSYLLTVRLIPIAPIWLVNIAAALVRMPLSTYCAATVLGVIPSTFIYASIGAGLDRTFLAPSAAAASSLRPAQGMDPSLSRHPPAPSRR